MIVKRGQRGSVQSVGHSVQIAVEEARVHVEGHGPAGVPQHPLDHLDVGAGGHGEAGCRVPELMGRDVAEAGSPERRVGHPASLVAQHDHPAAGCVKTRSSGFSPAQAWASLSTSERGTSHAARVDMPDGRSRQACIDQFDDPGGDVGAFDPRYGSGAEGSPLRLLG
jgi:hypothetical protein